MKKKKIDSNKLLNRLLIYKSILCRNTIFELDSNNEELNTIINALNIKNRKQRINYIYDYCCDKIDNYVKGKNVCGFKNNKCYTQNYEGCKYINGCCRRCVFQTSKGCATKNLTCKLFYCTEVTKRFKVIERKDLKILKILSIRQNIILNHDYFSSREEVLKDLYIGSIVIFLIRFIYRIITKNFIFSNNRLKNRY